LDTSGNKDSRVAIVAFPQWNGGHADSMSIYFHEICDTLQHKGWHPVPACRGQYAASLEYLVGRSSRFDRLLLKLAAATRVWLLEYHLFLLLCALHRVDVTLVAISQEYAPSLLKTRAIVVVHDFIQCRFPRSFLIKSLHLYFIPWSLRRVRNVISASQTTRDLCQAMGIGSVVVYNHFEPAEQRPADDRKPGTVVWVGTTARHKGLDTLLAAAALRPDMQFDVVLPPGQVPATSPAKNVRIVSGLSFAQLMGLYWTSDIFVSTSLDEGYGRPAMEARIRGAKLVLSDISVYREIHAGRAHFFVPGDAASLADTLAKAQADQDAGARDATWPSALIARENELAETILTMVTSTDAMVEQP
jgi:glycosyltransferase involved in cell wall biosynthesis